LLQIDESSDMPRLAVVLVFVRYLFQNKTEEDLLSKCEVLKLFLQGDSGGICITLGNDSMSDSK